MTNKDGKTNLLDGVSYTENAYLNASGVETTNQNDFHYTDYIPFNGNEHTLFVNRTVISSYIRIHGYNSNKEWVKQIIADNFTKTGVYGIYFLENVAYIRISTNKGNKLLAVLEGDAI